MYEGGSVGGRLPITADCVLCHVGGRGGKKFERSAILKAEKQGQGLICILGVFIKNEKAWRWASPPFSFCLFVSSPANFFAKIDQTNIRTMMPLLSLLLKVI
jgi:hypothetical protein